MLDRCRALLSRDVPAEFGPRQTLWKRHRATKLPLTEPARRSVQISPCAPSAAVGRAILAPPSTGPRDVPWGDRVSGSTHLVQEVDDKTVSWAFVLRAGLEPAT